MAKAKLEFDLDNIDDESEFYRATHARDMASALWEISHRVRRECENEIERKGDNGEEGSMYDGMDLAIEKIHEILMEYNLDVDRLNQ